MRMFVALTLATLCLGTVQGLVEVGSFRNLQHRVGGKVYAKDEKTLVIKGFSYDGQGPDAFFWAGKSGSPSSVGTILPYPFEGKFFEYEDQSAPILERSFNNEDITLTLPDTLKASDIKWLSIWCRRFSVNFGDLFFPEGLSFEAKKPELPPPIVHNDVDHEDVAYAEPEPESESEPEPEGEYTSPKGDASSLNLDKLLLLLIPVIFH